ncbi:MAG: DUF4097 family beta strand repeat protein [Gammaproteobacteria bacterium]|nr:DUF4097 family beta strand repeat protein [Gammaproteobacteria bacterium]
MFHNAIVMATAAAALTIALPASAADATLQKAWSFNATAASGLQVDNLMGKVVVERHAGTGYHVTATVIASGKDDAAARRLAEALRFETRDAADGQSLKVVYPLAAYDEFYWADAPGSSWWGTAGVEYLGKRVRLSGDRDDAADVHVDLLIRVPESANLTVRNPLGSLRASGVSGKVRLDSAQASQDVQDSAGEFSLDTGSGQVNVRGFKGRLDVDTGSGDVAVADCDCRLSADTGSGSVRVTASKGALQADTGSGDVTVERHQGSIKADTGSGDVRATQLSAVEELDADTGSGNVHMQGDLAALRRLRVDTGSGDVEIVTSALPSMELVIDTGSGDIQVDAPTASSREDHGKRIVTLGEGAGRGVIDTGSGNASLRLSP